jgi:predicted DNA-binding transcriptional regulator YafY
MLFGRFGYLVANAGDRGVLTYRMDLIEEAKQTSVGFEYPKGFNLKEWSAESFGVFHGDELLEVKLRFSASVADRAESVRFHGSQKIERLPDGSLQVIFKCRGHQELFWELCHPDWAGNVRIEGPDELIEEFRQYVFKLREEL